MALANPDILAFRIGDGRYPLFDGRGAMLEGGRWNSPGHAVIYGSLSQAGAMLEVLAHASIGKLPHYSKMIIIKIPGSLAVETADPVTLPGWDHLNNHVSRQFGDEWIISCRSVALLIPSVVAQCDRNIAINQTHPDFGKLTASDPESVQWDSRLFSTPPGGSK